MPAEPHALLVGLDFRSAGVEIRERLSFPEAEIPGVLARLAAAGVAESVILSTCNRVEVYAAHPDAEACLEQLTAFLAAEKGLAADDLRPHLYRRRCEDAVDHLFSVAAGAGSMIVGEVQILHQIRRAYELASAQGRTGGVLNKLFQGAIRVGKQVRAETDIGYGTVSVGSVAVDLIGEVFPENSSFRLLLLGAGEVAELAATHLKKYGNADIRVASRTREHALGLVERFGGSLADFAARTAEAAASDIVIVSTAAPEFVLRREELAPLLKGTEGRLRFMIDLSVPRNIDPAIGAIEGVILYTIDDLRKVADANRERRGAAMDAARGLIASGREEYVSWYGKQRVRPAIELLRARLEESRRSILRGAARRAAEAGPGAAALLDDVTTRLVERVVGEVLRNMDRAGADPAAVDAAVRLLHQQPEEP